LLLLPWRWRLLFLLGSAIGIVVIVGRGSSANTGSVAALGVPVGRIAVVSLNGFLISDWLLLRRLLLTAFIGARS